MLCPHARLELMVNQVNGVVGCRYGGGIFDLARQSLKINRGAGKRRAVRTRGIHRQRAVGRRRYGWLGLYHRRASDAADEQQADCNRAEQSV